MNPKTITLAEAYAPYGPDPHELIWDIINKEEYETTRYKIVKIDVQAWFKHATCQSELTIEETTKYFEPWQRKMVNKYRRDIQAKKPLGYLIIDTEGGKKCLIDGNHRLVAMVVEHIETAEAIDLAKPVESNPRGKPLLGGLFAEARKYNTFEEFERAFIHEIKHGLYWHVTANPHFTIDPLKGPRDMSSMGGGWVDRGKLMITSHLDYWVSEYGKSRLYAALIDMSEVSKNKYWQVNRGFGNEFWVDDPLKAKVVKVMPILNAKRVDRHYNAALPQSSEELRAIFEKAWAEA